MNKLLISYDISEQLLNESQSQEYESIKDLLEGQDEWVHLQKSVWVVVSKLSTKEMYDLLIKKIDKSKKTTVAVVNVSKQNIETRNYYTAKIPNDEYATSICSNAF